MIDNDPPFWNELDEWIEAARVASVLSYNRLGLMGHYYGGMLDIYTDTTRQCASFGGHIEMLEVDELDALRRKVTDPQIADRVSRFRHAFDVQGDCAPDALARAARTSVALDRLVELHDLGSMAPGPILEIGNTNSRYKFPIPARDFVNRWNTHGPAHHCAVGLGHVAPKLQKLASLLKLHFAQIC